MPPASRLEVVPVVATVDKVSNTWGRASAGRARTKVDPAVATVVNFIVVWREV